jgi:non-ribosomal peptide synthetase component F
VDDARPARQSFEGGRLFGRIAAEPADRLRTIGKTQGATLFMTLLAAFAALLSRYTDEPDLVIGTPVAGRHAPETDRMIGCFVNMLPLRCDLSGDPAFAELVRRVRDVALGAYRHEGLPFDRLVEELNPARDASRAPVFQVVLNMSSYTDLWSTPAEGLRVELLDVQHEPSMVDLTLYATEVADGIVLRAVYKSALFAPATIEQILRRFETMVEAASLDPDARLSSLPLLDAGEADALAGAFSGDLEL